MRLYEPGAQQYFGLFIEWKFLLLVRIVEREHQASALLYAHVDSEIVCGDVEVSAKLSKKVPQEIHARQGANVDDISVTHDGRCAIVVFRQYFTVRRVQLFAPDEAVVPFSIPGKAFVAIGPQGLDRQDPQWCNPLQRAGRQIFRISKLLRLGA